MTDPAEDEDSVVPVIVYLLEENWEKLYSAAATQGESFMDAVNRACAFYEMLHNTPVGQKATWQDNSGREREIWIVR